MVGAIITFLGVCGIVATYMGIVHSFLRDAEEPSDAAREERFRKQDQKQEQEHPAEAPSEHSRRPQWAH
ncbi:MAG TPA: hypothetical protein VK846_19595 [Candidatus Limnocylindria bacterium]|nr:hypothetical protein [Candidatus Limnocylindria bacterium]